MYVYVDGKQLYILLTKSFKEVFFMGSIQVESSI